MSDCFVTSCLSGFYVQKVCLYILIQRQNYLLCFYLLKEVNALQFCQQLFFVSTWMWVITRPLQFHWIQTFRQDKKNINFHNMRGAASLYCNRFCTRRCNLSVDEFLCLLCFRCDLSRWRPRGNSQKSQCQKIISTIKLMTLSMSLTKSKECAVVFTCYFT